MTEHPNEPTPQLMPNAMALVLASMFACSNKGLGLPNSWEIRQTHRRATSSARRAWEC
jgi:hypothetical protein